MRRSQLTRLGRQPERRAIPSARQTLRALGRHFGTSATRSFSLPIRRVEAQHRDTGLYCSVGSRARNSRGRRGTPHGPRRAPGRRGLSHSLSYGMPLLQTPTQPAPAYACPIALVCPPIECHHRPGDRTTEARRGRCRLRGLSRPPAAALPGRRSGCLAVKELHARQWQQLVVVDGRGSARGLTARQPTVSKRATLPLALVDEK
eukprot:scaffold21663_cov85-Phaeocystis_antarctica.AAC.2